MFARRASMPCSYHVGTARHMNRWCARLPATCHRDERDADPAVNRCDRLSMREQESNEDHRRAARPYSHGCIRDAGQASSVLGPAVWSRLKCLQWHPARLAPPCLTHGPRLGVAVWAAWPDNDRRSKGGQYVMVHRSCRVVTLESRWDRPPWPMHARASQSVSVVLVVGRPDQSPR